MSSIATVTVAGVGLIGGSFALALRRLGYCGRILGVSSPETLEVATRLGVIDDGCGLETALPQSDLVYMAQPVERIIGQLDQVRKLVPKHALVTDAGSTKSAIMERARTLFEDGPHFVGGHPMAGKEGRGVRVAEAELFQGALYALVPTGESLPESPVVEEFCGWLDAMGCRRRVMPASQHDRVVAWTSHLPQLVSTALAAAIGTQLQDGRELEIAGDGLRDMTRLAASPHAVWSGILKTNPGPIDEALAAVVQELEGLRDALNDGSAEEHFQRGQRLQGRIADR
ncbi:MAG: prephenate dehydrogenase/arogenate dehydrogenase family protein [Acidobacteriia bacterium]|nr:prephenate dehydrogenase/arogenate dehydrogenase family protein [Terriglobia bacterium]MYC64712.1 prephenate dehydrogenase/arogenate dehydrogenase family protein [Terriglobia bacterium]